MVGLSQKYVLVLDNEPLIRSMIQHMFNKLGYRTCLVDNSEAGLTAYETHKDKIDLVFTDHSGLAMIQQILTQDPDLPIILAKGNSFKVSDWERTPVKWLINKPIHFRTLQQTLKRINVSEAQLTD